IYNHFGSKEELVLAAYDRNADLQSDLIVERIRAASGAVDRLVAIVQAFQEFAHDPPFPGGCPTLNTAVESAGVDPRLHGRARERMAMLIDMIAGQARRGIERRQLRADV